jgi:general secretion pathway protein L
MLGRTVLGLDVGSWSVKAAELQAGLRGVEFLRLEHLVLPASAAPEEREATIQLFLEQRNLARDFVVTALPADRATQRHLRFPFTGAKRIDQAIAFEIEEELPMALDSVVITHETVPASPEQTDVLAILTPRREIDLHLQSMRRMDCEPHIVDVEGAALANLSHYLELADVGRLMLDIGHRKSTLCLLVDGKPVMLRTIAVAGHHFTEALARDRSMPYDAAEDLKHEGGLFEPISTKPLTDGVEALFDQLIREVMRSLQSVVGDPLDPIAPAEMLLTGGTAQCTGLAEYLGQRTALPCRLLEVPETAEGSVQLAETFPGVFAHAAALALRGSTTERVTAIDLRQGEFAYVPDLSGLRNQLQVTVALFGLLLALWMTSVGAQLWAAESRSSTLHDEITRMYLAAAPGEGAPPDPVAALETRLRDSRELANHLGVTGGGISVLEVLRQISSHIPDSLDISLSDLRLERHSVRARGYSQDFVSVDRVRSQLEAVPFFQEVVLSDVVNEPRRGGKSFSLTIKFEENGG